MFLIAALLTTFTASAQCLNFDASAAKIQWTAFKTPAKAGVKGSFDKITITPVKNKTAFDTLLKGSKFSVDTASVNTANPGRDAKLKEFFFMGTKIDGVVTGVSKKMITTEMTINGQKRTVPLAYTLDGTKLNAKGTIDVFDFSMSKHLTSINNACKALHEGKTWNDVNIELEVNFTGC
ncbi:YceI family protein [Bacteriovorax sp. Seq25_V]|uniref:YceI family protein n=1 Tax=Bacteriovorax sp. Seq25_V TaxID=1201288 RepID=UPI00038A2EFD|nr:YceI family protein [Bacteriovorax sp. Seq25_V]EQC43893.1 YceI-like domain protein [Bacteriovorax sp. Seq25_V]